MQYLYTLTSTPGDNYYEQFLLSAASLKLKMPSTQIVLLCDSKTKETLTGKRSEYEKLTAKVITKDAPSSFSQVDVSRWIKTSMRRFVQGDFLFIDCDTIITDDLSYIEKLNVKFGACLDKHSLVDSHNNKNLIVNNDKQLGFSSYTGNRHFNSGVIYCADSPEIHKVFDRWHELWLIGKNKNISRDQPAFNQAIHENLSLFTELDGIWNCQIAYNGLPYLANSKIIHYFATDNIYIESPYLLTSESILEYIKNYGIINDETLKLLENPRRAFKEKTQIMAGNDMLYVVNSNLFQFIYLLKKKSPLFYNFLNSICSTLKKITKGILIRSKKKKNIYN